ncbi:MAG: L,D-transpeptidase [Gammaproteobacteria bacterium]|nr:L,D-transpeptidase [Gammaproteobacteria bacterium]
MNKALIVVSSVGLLLSACSTLDGGRSIPIVDDGGFTHYTMSRDSDNRGSNYFPMKRAATGHKVFIFDPKATAWAAYDAQGNRLDTGAASGGSNYCDDIGRPCRTVTGTYHVYSKKGENCKSSMYPVETHGGARMPYCMHFNGAYSIHAAYDVPNHNASHGCIRVLPDAARWLNEDFMDVGTTVVVKPY